MKVKTNFYDMMDYLYRYQIVGEDCYGAVIARSEEEAVAKVRQAYLQFGYTENELKEISVASVALGHVFEECPDVLEIL